MIITIASGKGGTGKTTFAVNLAYALADRGTPVRLLDCDVEEPNDHLFVQPEFAVDREVSVLKPVWDSERCTHCGACADACNYNALALIKDQVLVFNELCHSCGVCSYVCPEDAFTEAPSPIGLVQQTNFDATPFPFAHGLLNIGEALAPNIVNAVKEFLAPDAVNIIDASPGTACPVVAAVEGADAALLVTEPTPFGLNDLKLAVGLTLKLGVPTGIIINRSDGVDKIITDYAAAVGIPIAGRIPFQRRYAEHYAEGRILATDFPKFRTNVLEIFDDLATACPAPPPPDHVPTTTVPATFARGNSRTHREITVISGKGGTGKTTLTGALARLGSNQVLADNDVDAANLHLLLAPQIQESHDFVGGVKARIEPELCRACGQCAEACHFDAIQQDGKPGPYAEATYRIEPLACEGCGLCPRVCPFDAIASEPNVTGQWHVSATEPGPMVHARLGIAEENSGRLVSQVRRRAAELARELELGAILGDGPPGTGCPVIASVSGTDLVLIVTEPSIAGVHDLERVLLLSAHFGVPTAVVINKADLNQGQSNRITKLAAQHNARVIGRIPFDPAVNAALMAGKTVVEYGQSPAATAIQEIQQQLETCFQQTPAPSSIPNK